MNRLSILFLILMPGLCVPGRLAAGQRGKTAKTDPSSPVTVLRSATFQINIASDAMSVFDFLSDQNKLSRWFPDQAIMEPSLGGRVHFRFKNGVWGGVVTEYIRGNALSYSWQGPSDTSETKVRFKLTPQGGETFVEMVHSNFTTSSDLEAWIKLWKGYLENLKSVIETGTDMRGAAAKPSARPAAKPRRSK